MSLIPATGDLLPSSQYVLIHDVLCACGIIVGILGIIGNLANVFIFIVMGVKDGVTVSFLFLTFSDLCYVTVLFANLGTTEIWLQDMKSNYAFSSEVDPRGIIIFFGNTGNLIYTNITLITSFLALVRCLCVSKPLYFRNTFTRERSLWIMLGFSFISLFSYLPILATMEMRWQPDTATNTTRLKLWFSPNREIIKNVVWGIKDTFLLPVTQVLIFVCVSVMVYYLRQVSRFRQKFLPATVDQDLTRKPEDFDKTQDTQSFIYSHKELLGGRPESPGKKKLNVVRQVSLISFISMFRQPFLPSIVVCIDQYQDRTFETKDCAEYIGSISVKPGEEDDIYDPNILGQKDDTSVPNALGQKGNTSVPDIVGQKDAIYDIDEPVHKNATSLQALGHQYATSQPNAHKNATSLQALGHQYATSQPNAHKNATSHPKSLGRQNTTSQLIAQKLATTVGDLPQRRKELHVIRQVALVSLLYVLTNMPRMAVTMTVLAVPAFSPAGRHKNIYDLMMRFIETIQMFNSSVSFLIYYNYNSKFRSLCKM